MPRQAQLARRSFQLTVPQALLCLSLSLKPDVQVFCPFLPSKWVIALVSALLMVSNLNKQPAVQDHPFICFWEGP